MKVVLLEGFRLHSSILLMFVWVEGEQERLPQFGSHPRIHIWATVVVAAAVRSRIRRCEDFGADSTLASDISAVFAGILDAHWEKDKHSWCYCPSGRLAIGDGCGNALRKNQFRLDEIGVGDCRGLK